MQVLFSRYVGQMRQGLIGRAQDASNWHNGVAGDTERRLQVTDMSCYEAASKLAQVLDSNGRDKGYSQMINPLLYPLR